MAADRAKKGRAGTSDPYVVVQSTNGAKGKTSVNTPHPES
jgi:Ca2+-dependent lipid-binding protein